MGNGDIGMHSSVEEYKNSVIEMLKVILNTPQHAPWMNLVERLWNLADVKTKTYQDQDQDSYSLYDTILY